MPSAVGDTWRNGRNGAGYSGMAIARASHGHAAPILVRRREILRTRTVGATAGLAGGPEPRGPGRGSRKSRLAMPTSEAGPGVRPGSRDPIAPARARRAGDRPRAGAADGRAGMPTSERPVGMP